MLTWKKLASSKWEQEWMERLSFLGPQRLAITALAGKKTIRIEAYGLSTREARELKKLFGGVIQQLKDVQAFARTQSPRKAIAIRKNLLVVSSRKEWQAAQAQFPNKKIILIPAAMAFGTGEHATTAGCLRFLSDLAGASGTRPWDLLDLGTGSGILAIAGKTLGARRVEAYDFDPHAVRATKENLKLNQLGGVVVKQGDVTRFEPARQWEVVAANLFSEVLIQSAPIIARATRPGGWLIFSGVLREQEKATVAAFRKEGFQVKAYVRKGKWVAAMAQASVVRHN